MPTFLDGSGKPIELGRELGRGGEGAVYEVLSDAALVAKLYHQPADLQKTEKLNAMVASGTPEIRRFAAWPLSTLVKNRRVVGIVMPKIAQSAKPVHELYTPKSRLQDFPAAKWDFLIHVAINISKCFAAIHAAGQVVGDVNHGNALIVPNGVAAFIDCDSFQVKSLGRVFLCDVGVSTYTPPELTKFSVERTPNHDAFGLAVLIFHLLFMGRHPFAGRFSGKGDMPIERAIKEYRFAFSSSASQMQMAPPPNSLLLDQVSGQMKAAFETAFSREAAQLGTRPTAADWAQTLNDTKEKLKACSINKAHIYFDRLVSCPWCPIEQHGIVLFIDISIPVTSTLQVDGILLMLRALPNIDVLPPVPVTGNCNFAPLPTAESKTSGLKRRLRMAVGTSAVILTIAICVLTKVDPTAALLAVIAAIGIALALPRKQQKLKMAAKQIVQSSELKYQDLQQRYAKECSSHPFAEKLRTVQALKTEYDALPLQRQRKIAELEKNKYQVQLLRYLSKYSINDASISGFGMGRKQMLISFGVDSAADATPLKVEVVPNIGPKLAARLYMWRASIEKSFRFDPSRSIDKSEIDNIDREIARRRLELEARLSSESRDAVKTHSRLVALRTAYLSQIETALRALVQAQADYKAS